jgi:hypothetical protein
MANVSEFSIVTYLRKPGHWRAAIIPNARIGSVGGERVRTLSLQGTDSRIQARRCFLLIPPCALAQVADQCLPHCWVG